MICILYIFDPNSGSILDEDNKSTYFTFHKKLSYPKQLKDSLYHFLFIGYESIYDNSDKLEKIREDFKMITLETGVPLSEKICWINYSVSEIEQVEEMKTIKFNPLFIKIYDNQWKLLKKHINKANEVSEGFPI